VFVLRIVDVFLLRSDEVFRVQVLTKVLGLILIVVYVWKVKGSLRSIGLHPSHWKFNVVLGLLTMTVGLLVGYGAEWLYLTASGAGPELYVAAEGHTLIPEDAATGGVFFALTLLMGNVINSFMEEGLFRGILLTHLGSRMSVWKANFVQAVIFGVWHIVWPLRDYLDGKTSLNAAVGISAGYVLLAGMIGFSWGYFYQKTNSLWGSWTAHTLNNSVINFIHVTTLAGAPSTLGFRVAIATLLVVFLLPVVKNVTEKRGMSGLDTWANVARLGS
jgi:membrane protease YdiL (CAAX protease family)